MNLDAILEDFRRSLSYIPDGDRLIVERALRIAEEAHHGQIREDGSPYFAHLVAVGKILTDWHADGETIAAGLLHDALEDTPLTEERMRGEFGPTVTGLVVGVTKFTQADFAGQDKLERKTETLRKLFEVMRADIRVALIKLADRLHNVRTMETFPEDRRKRFAQETLKVYHPIAYHLGMHDLRREFSDRCMPWGYPEETNELQQLRAHALTMIERDLPKIEDALREHDPDGKLLSLSSHAGELYSMMLMKQRGEEIQNVAYLVAIAGDTDGCYDLLKILHGLYRPISGKFRDYIAVMDHYYQSLHTTVIGPHEQLIPIRIRTKDMDAQERQGAIHSWFLRRDNHGDRSWLERSEDLDKFTRESSKEFWDALQSDIFQETISVSVNGQNVSVPTGSTALDAVYVAFGRKTNRLNSLTVNAVERSPSTSLRVDDVIQAEFAVLPKVAFEWLHSVTTSYARSIIVSSLKERNQGEKIGLGQQLLQRELDHFRMGLVTDLSRVQRQNIATHFKRPTFDEVLSMIGEGVLEARDVTFFLFPKTKPILPFQRSSQSHSFRVAINGTMDPKHDILSQVAAIARMHHAKLHNTQLQSNPRRQTFALYLSGTSDDRLHFADFLSALERQEGVSGVTTFMSRSQKVGFIGSFLLACAVIFLDILLIPFYQQWSSSLSLFPYIVINLLPLLPIIGANHYLLIKLQRTIPWIRTSRLLLGLGFFMNIVGILFVFLYQTILGTHVDSLIPFLATFVLSTLYLGYRFFKIEASLTLRQPAVPISEKEWDRIKKRKITGYAIRLCAVIVWGIFPLSIKYTGTVDLHPLTRVFVISLGALLATAILCAIASIAAPKKRKSLRIPMNVYMANLIIGQIGLLFFAGLSLYFTTSTNYLLLQNFAPSIALIVALIFWRKSIAYLKEPKHMLWVFIVFLMGSTGSSLIIYNSIQSMNIGTVNGDLLSLVTMAFDTLLVIAQIRYLKLAPEASGCAMNFYMFGSICAIFLPVITFAAFMNSTVIPSVSGGAIAAGLATGAILGIGELLNYEAFRRIDGFIAFLMFNISILVTFVFEVVFIGNVTPTFVLLVGALIIIGSTIIAEIINSRCEKQGL